MNYKIKTTLITIVFITGSFSISFAQLSLVNEPDKPSVNAGITGLGWSMNEGGCIKR